MGEARVGLYQYFGLSDEGLAFAAQLGVSGICMNMVRVDDGSELGYASLLDYRRRCEEHGLALEAIENVPLDRYTDAMLGGPRRDEQIEWYRGFVRDMGRAQVPTLGLHWMPNLVWRTSRETSVRGGAHATAFDLDLVDDALTHGREYTAEEMRTNLEGFMDAVLPVAEEAGVRIAVHPDDPPVASLGGVARILRSFEDFAWATDRFESSSFGLNFCMGTWSEMGPGVLDAIRYFGRRGRIVYAHFRDVRGHVPRFTETFLGDGNLDPVEAMRTFLDAGFDGFFLDDHVPQMVGEDGFNFRGRAHATGYISGLLDASRRNR